MPSCCKTQWKGREDGECLAAARHSGRGEKMESVYLLQDTVEGERRRGVSSCCKTQWKGREDEECLEKCCKTQWKGREDEECLAVARHGGRGEKTRSA